MERWQLTQKEMARYGIVQNTIEEHLNVDLAREEVHLCRRQILHFDLEGHRDRECILLSYLRLQCVHE